jgi:hypothetical protein
MEQILSRIDEQLGRRARFGGRPPERGVLRPIPPLPDASGLSPSVTELRSSTAPLYATEYGRRSQRMPRQVVNAALKPVVGRQGAFNAAVADVAATLAEQTLALRHRTDLLIESLHTLSHVHDDQAERMVLVEAELARTARGLDAVESLEASLVRLSDQMNAAEVSLREEQERLREEQHGTHRWLEELVKDLQRLATDQHGISDWVRLLERKVFGLSLAVRDSSTATETDESLEPRIVDQDALDAKVAAAGDRIRLNLGAGEKTMTDYLNVDGRELPEIDIVADVRHLPFESGTVDEIMSAHLVEHFREHEMQSRILPYWRDLLRPGGRLVIICPNLAAILESLNDGKLSMDDFRLLVFGGQEYVGDDHFAGYTPEGLHAMLRAVGFVDVETVVAARMDGICPEMEVVATR